MAPCDTDVIDRVLEALTDAEREGGVAYLLHEPVGAGDTFPASPTPIAMAGVCHLAFIDPSPSANWGHDCRYLTVDSQTLAVASHAARFPPTGLAREPGWQLIHRGSQVPDNLILDLND